MKLRHGKKYAFTTESNEYFPTSEYVSRQRKIITNVQMSQTMPNAGKINETPPTTKQQLVPTDKSLNSEVNIASVRNSNMIIEQQQSNVEKEVKIVKKSMISSTSITTAANVCHESSFEAKSGQVVHRNNVTIDNKQIDNNKQLPKSLLKQRRSIFSLLTSTPLFGKTKKHVSFSNDLSLTEDKSKREYDFNNSFSQKVDVESSFCESKTVKKLLYQNELDTDSENSLESYVFPDISFSNVGSIWTDNGGKVDNFSKLDGSFMSNDYSDDEINLNASSMINHINRSHYRHKRRIWYLNRRNKYKQNIFYRYFYSYVLLVVLKIVRSMKRIVRYTKKVTRHLSILRNIVIVTTYVSNVFQHILSRIWLKLTKLIFFTFTAFKQLIFSCRQIIVKSALFQYAFAYDNDILQEKSTSSYNTGISDSTDGIHVAEMKEDEDDLILFCCWNCGLFLLALICFIPILLLLTSLYSGDKILLLPNPEDHGITNAYPLLLGDSSGKFPVYHIRPPLVRNLPVKKSFEFNAPVILYLRGKGEIYFQKRIQIFEILSSLGYHVIVPVNVLTRSEINIIWSWIKAKAMLSQVYIWSDQINSRVLTSHAKDFCQELIPPNGIIIETSLKYDVQQHRSLEVWTCNCTMVDDGNGDFFKYNHVKCPITATLDKQDVKMILYDQIVSCVEALTRNMN